MNVTTRRNKVRAVRGLSVEMEETYGCVGLASTAYLKTTSGRTNPSRERMSQGELGIFQQ